MQRAVAATTYVMRDAFGCVLKLLLFCGFVVSLLKTREPACLCDFVGCERAYHHQSSFVWDAIIRVADPDQYCVSEPDQ